MGLLESVIDRFGKSLIDAGKRAEEEKAHQERVKNSILVEYRVVGFVPDVKQIEKK